MWIVRNWELGMENKVAISLVVKVGENGEN